MISEVRSSEGSVVGIMSATVGAGRVSSGRRDNAAGSRQKQLAASS